MKKSIVLIVGFCLLTLWGCVTDEGDSITTEAIESRAKSAGTNVSIPEIIKNEVVIQYRVKGLSEEKKLSIQHHYERLHKFKVTERKPCDCDNNDIELWTIDLTNSKFSKIEGAIGNMGGPEPEGGVEANLNFYFQIRMDRLNGRYSSSLVDKVANNTNNEDVVNIAILDTGIDYDFFPEPFLYDSSGTSECQDEISGWDFVNNDNDPRDDQGHGTVVAKIITNKLDLYNIPYRIMAVKAFDQTGRGSYWTTICGLNHIAKKQKQFIVNTSFGFYKLTDQTIFKNVIEDASDRLLLVSSAGNNGVDTDIAGNEHFPSGYDSDNILTVGGYIEGELMSAPIFGSQYISGLLIASNSNYGSNSIDALGPFDEHQFELIDVLDPNNPILINVEGTSFAAAEVTGRAARLFRETIGTPITIKEKTLDSGFLEYGLNSIVNSGKVIVRNLINTANQPTTGHY
ncbi:S8 family serine peptidase [Aquimarina sp. 2201CG1-2-11]|uniref:S8 family peptidase n=1 Tax=Aquimarina discodermiae TaxID=3231043 RepID=UPI00346364DF